MLGFEEILGFIADKIGIDLRKMSAPRIAFVAVLYFSAGLVLLTGGVYNIAYGANGIVSIIAGTVCTLVGAAYLFRISKNLSDVLMQKRK